MVDTRDQPRPRQRVELETVAKSLLLSKSALDRAILSDLTLLKLNAVLADPGAASKPRPPSEFTWKTLIRGWINLKEWGLEYTGKRLASLVRDRTSDGGRSLCKKLDYCRRKAWLRERLDMLEKLSEEQTFAAERATDFIVQRVPDGSELLTTAKEFVESVSDELVDTVIPVSLAIKIFKYGLDDLCPCCKSCEGTGKQEGGYCTVCGGDGFRNPFVV